MGRHRDFWGQEWWIGEQWQSRRCLCGRCRDFTPATEMAQVVAGNRVSLQDVRRRSLTVAARKGLTRGETSSHQGGRSTPGRIRTCDLRFRKPPLYPLSYRRATCLGGTCRDRSNTLPSAETRPRHPEPGVHARGRPAGLPYIGALIVPSRRAEPTGPAREAETNSTCDSNT